MDPAWPLRRQYVQVQQQAPHDQISGQLLQRAKQPFALWLKAQLWSGGRARLREFDSADVRTSQQLWPVIRDYVREHYKDDIVRYKQLLQLADMGRPELWYPFARSIPRKIIYHAGPTNSGKTYNALQALKAAETGLYCGPLRLLAVEIFDRLNAEGLPCDLLTGQERLEVPGARHAACTVEMASLNTMVDVCVIDEIQMMADPGRGWAWTKALLGVPAAEIHVCGDYSVLHLVQHMCAAMKCDVEVHEYERMTALTVDEEGLGPEGYANVRAGDCVVAFSRRDIYAIKASIEEQTDHKAAVIYGALPPETRRAQARLFNDPDSDWKVLVASDAIGMGLNLNIRRVIFHATSKWNSSTRTREDMDPSSTKQIAGRAGRRGTEWENGLVTTYAPEELPRLRAALDVPLKSFRATAAGLLPEYEQFELYSRQLGYPDRCTFADLIASFATESKQDKAYFLCNQEGMLELATRIEGIHPLSLRERFTLCSAPVLIKDASAMNAFLQFTTQYAVDGEVRLSVKLPDRAPTTWPQMNFCEAVYHISSLWLWLSYRFGDAFVGRDQVQETTQQLSSMLNEGLQLISTRAQDDAESVDEDRPDIWNMVQTKGITIPAPPSPKK